MNSYWDNIRPKQGMYGSLASPDPGAATQGPSDSYNDALTQQRNAAAGMYGTNAPAGGQAGGKVSPNGLFWINPDGTQVSMANRQVTDPNVDQSYKNIGKGDMYSGMRNGQLWVAGNMVGQSTGDTNQDNLTLAQFGYRPNQYQNPSGFWMGNSDLNEFMSNASWTHGMGEDAVLEGLRNITQDDLSKYSPEQQARIQRILNGSRTNLDFAGALANGGVPPTNTYGPGMNTRGVPQAQTATGPNPLAGTTQGTAAQQQPVVQQAQTLAAPQNKLGAVENTGQGVGTPNTSSGTATTTTPQTNSSAAWLPWLNNFMQQHNYDPHALDSLPEYLRNQFSQYQSSEDSSAGYWQQNSPLFTDSSGRQVVQVNDDGSLNTGQAVWNDGIDPMTARRWDPDLGWVTDVSNTRDLPTGGIDYRMLAAFALAAGGASMFGLGEGGAAASAGGIPSVAIPGDLAASTIPAASGTLAAAPAITATAAGGGGIAAAIESAMGLPAGTLSTVRTVGGLAAALTGGRGGGTSGSGGGNLLNTILQGITGGLAYNRGNNNINDFQNFVSQMIERGDPYGPQRADAIRRLGQLEANPGSVTSNPLFSAMNDKSQEDLMRLSAAGRLGSGHGTGGEQAALQDNFLANMNKFYNDEWTRTAREAGVFIDPSTAISGGMRAAGDVYRAQTNNDAYLAALLGSMFGGNVGGGGSAGGILDWILGQFTGGGSGGTGGDNSGGGDVTDEIFGDGVSGPDFTAGVD